MRLFRLLLPVFLMVAFALPAFAQAQKPIHMLVRTVWPMRANEKVDCQLYLWTDDGPLSFNKMKQVAGSKLHVLMMSADWKNIYHAYPIATGEGEFRFSIEPSVRQPLRVWAIFETDAGKQTVIADLNKDPIAAFSPLQDPQIIQSETDAMVFTIHFPRQVRAGVPIEGTVYATLKQAKKPFTELEADHGSYAYFAAVANDFVTLNPIENIDPPAEDGIYGGPTLRFRVTPVKEGLMRVAVAVHARGEDLLLPFTIRVAPALSKGHAAPYEDPDQTPSLPPDSKMGE